MPSPNSRAPGARDAALVALTRAANNSVLWMGAAAVLALVGGKRGRRAAVRGLTALAAASAVSNGPLKFAFRSKRPTRRPLLISRPGTYSFPSGHSASAFAFAAGASAECPAAAPVLVPLASAVAYSRVRVGVHRVRDVLAGGAVGVGCAALVVWAARRSRTVLPQRAPGTDPGSLPAEVVLVTSPDAGGSTGLASALGQLRRAGLSVAAQLDIGDIGRLPAVLAELGNGPRLVIAAGGDGTVGAVADCLAELADSADSAGRRGGAGGGGVLGILPLGASNDFARSLRIPMDPRRAAALLTGGKIADVDLGRLSATGQRPRHFVHAATAGLNVNFARFATRASVRARFGHLTYLVAAGKAFRNRPAFECELRYDGRTEKVTLTQLSVINAPVFGGALGLGMEGSGPDDRLLDVLAFEDIPSYRLLLAASFLLLRVRRPLTGIRAMHVSRLHVHTQRQLAAALDGEVIGRLPGDFEVVGEALRVITPLDFADVNDEPDGR